MMSNDADDLRNLKHDIKNQLSSITLALEQLRYEVPDQSDDFELYFDMIASGAKNIDDLLKTFH